MMWHFELLVVSFLVTAQFTSGRWLQKAKNDRFEDLLAKKIQENQDRDGSVHGHIVAVNDASDWLIKKNANGEIPLTEEIEAANEAENKELFEGDIRELKTSLNDVSEEMSQSEAEKRNVMARKERLWPTTQVPYYVSPELGHMRGLINDAVNEFSKRTCVVLREVDTSYSGDHIRLVKGHGCSSNVGRVGGGQNLYLGPGCEYVGVIIHEMMHSLGVWHEQSRPDRDQYVEILWHNIQEGRQKNFMKYGHGKLDDLGLDYDIRSIMHYDRYLFSKSSNKPTIIARGRPWASLGGQLQGTMTSNDVKELNNLFNC